MLQKDTWIFTTVRDRPFSHLRIPCLGGYPMSASLFSKQSLGLTQKVITRRSAPQLLLNQLVASHLFQLTESWLGRGATVAIGILRDDCVKGFITKSMHRLVK